MTTATVLAAAQERLPEDVGKAGPLGLLLIVVLLVATAFLVRSMSRHLKKVPRSFDPQDRVEVPDTPAELLERPAPGEGILDTLRRAPLAIEPPRSEKPRSGEPRSDGPRSDGPRSDGTAPDPRDR